MAGLLSDAGDFIFGEDKTKDEYGQTQADRRMPIWGGLIKSGLLMAAGGQRMMPEQRAQYIGQIGGALGGIPQEMIQARSESAKQLLQQQNITTNRNKLANQAKIQAYAASPDGMKALAGLKPHEQFAAKIALESGDIDAFSRIMNGVGTAEARAATLTLREQKLELDRQKQEQSGTWKGTGLENQALNLMERGASDEAFRSTLAYATAYDTLKMGRQYYDKEADGGRGAVVDIKPRDMSRYWPPTYTGGPPGSQPPPAAPPVPPPVPPPAPATGAGQPTPPVPPPVPPPAPAGPGGTPPVPPAVPPPVVPPAAPGSSGPVVQLPGGGTASSTPLGGPAKPPPPAAIEKFNNHKVGAQSLIAAMEGWRNELHAATGGDKAKSVAGFTTRLTTAAGLSQMLAKGDALLELGVLNGQDLPVIQAILPDPKTFKGTLADAEAAIDQVKEIVEYRIKLREALLYGKPEPQMPAMVARAAKASQPAKGYVMPNGRKVTQEDVEATAKMHGVTVDQVMRDLKLKRE